MAMIHDAPTSASANPSLRGVLTVLLLSSIPILLTGFLRTLTVAKWPILVGALVLLVPALLYLRRKHCNLQAVFRLNTISGRVMAVTLVLGLAITAIVLAFDATINQILPFPKILRLQMREALLVEGAFDWFILILGGVILVGTFEEMLFRGMVQTTLEIRHSPLPAIALTAVLFGAVHLDPWRFLQFIVLGFFLGILAWKSKSIIPSAIVHAQNNLIAVIISNTSESSELSWLANTNDRLMVLAVAIVLAVIGFHLYFRFCDQDEVFPTLLNT